MLNYKTKYIQHTKMILGITTDYFTHCIKQRVVNLRGAQMSVFLINANFLNLR